MPEKRVPAKETFKKLKLQDTEVYFGRHTVGAEPLFQCDWGETVWPPDIREDIGARKFHVLAVDGLSAKVFLPESMPCNRGLIERNPPLIVLGADMPIYSKPPIEQQAYAAWENVFERLRMEDPTFKPPGDVNAFISEQVEKAYKKESLGIGASLFTANVLLNLIKNQRVEPNADVPSPVRRALLKGFLMGLGGTALSVARRPLFIAAMNTKTAAGDSIVGDIARVTVPFTVSKTSMDVRNARFYLVTQDRLKNHPGETAGIVLGAYHEVGAQIPRQWSGKTPQETEKRMLDLYRQHIAPVVRDVRGSIDKDVLYQTLWELFSRYSEWKVVPTKGGSFTTEIISDTKSIPAVNALLKELIRD